MSKTNSKLLPVPLRASLWLAAAILAAIGVSAGPAQADTKVVSILDATGPINIYGAPMIDATRMAIDAINAQGGVLGQKLVLTEYDGQSTNDKYVQYANQAILRDKAVVIMGGAAARPLLPIAVRAVIGYALQRLQDSGEGAVAHP